MNRVICAVVGVLATLFGLMLSPGLAPTESAATAQCYTYDSHHHRAASTYTASERGPPATYDRDITQDAVDRWPRGASARPEAVPTCAYTVDEMLARSARVVRGGTTTQEQVRRSDRESSSLALAGVAANGGVRAAETCLNSFTGTTLVLMADGTKQPIRDVKLGDKVMATDPVTGERGPRKVIDLIRHSGPHTMVAVRLSDGSTIDATDRHPFWVESRATWVDAIDLQPGDVVVDADGDRLTVTNLGIRDQDLTAYNLTVNELHTYFVGADAVLVHNAGCWSIGSRLKAAGPGTDMGLPSSGRIRFVPEQGYNPVNPLPRGPQGGYIDRFGNEWVVGPSRTAGHPFEWDVQLSRTGQAQLDWLSRDGSHINVSLFGGHALMNPLPFFALVRTRGPGTQVDPNKPLAVGVVLGRSEGPGGWVYSVSIGELTYSFGHEELIPLGCVFDRVVIYGSDEELEAAQNVCHPALGDSTP